MKKYILYGILAVVLSFILISVWGTFYKTAGKDMLFDVKSGDGTRDIAHNLKEKGLIYSSLIFSVYVYQNHILLQNGVYKITSSMTMPQIISMMKEGKVQEYLVTIPEGWRLTQIDELLSSRKIINKGDLIKIASADEGYLFPDTYRFELGVNATDVKELMRKDFNDKISGLNVTRDELIVASIVEREAKFDEDRAKIAGVYLSRLDQGMKLEADPTVQYAKGSWEPITVADYQNVISPYNTYVNTGLPPGPICNPGLKSLQATINPIKDGNLYFFTDSNGHAVFSKTLEEHRAKLKSS
jgi:UPF0755 protein